MKNYIKDTVLSTIISMIVTFVVGAAVKEFKKRKVATKPERHRDLSPSVRIYEDQKIDDEPNEDDDLKLKADAINNGYKPIKY